MESRKQFWKKNHLNIFNVKKINQKQCFYSFYCLAFALLAQHKASSAASSETWNIKMLPGPEPPVYHFRNLSAHKTFRHMARWRRKICKASCPRKFRKFNAAGLALLLCRGYFAKFHYWLRRPRHTFHSHSVQVGIRNCQPIIDAPTTSLIRRVALVIKLYAHRFADKPLSRMSVGVALHAKVENGGKCCEKTGEGKPFSAAKW